MKQTAIEWLLNEFQEAHKDFGGLDLEWLKRFNQAKEMEKQQLSEYLNELSRNINRVEVIQHSPPYNGRAYTNREAKHVEISLQDNNETLKIFLV
jgi:hypothetical protein